MLWWLGSTIIVAAVAGILLSNWHWYSLLTKARSMIVSPELSGFRAPYQNSEIAANGISPNGQVAFILGHSEEERVADPPNCLATRSHPGQFFDLPTHIQTSSLRRQSYYGVIRWAKDSSAMLCFDNCSRPTDSGPFKRGAYDIYVVPFVNGQPRKSISMEIEILKVAFPEAATKAQVGQFKDIPAMYVQIDDQGMDDNLTFNDTDQIIVDCWCESTPREKNSDGSPKPWTMARVTGVWDPIKEAFVKKNSTLATPPQ